MISADIERRLGFAMRDAEALRRVVGPFWRISITLGSDVRATLVAGLTETWATPLDVARQTIYGFPVDDDSENVDRIEVVATRRF